MSILSNLVNTEMYQSFGTESNNFIYDSSLTTTTLSDDNAYESVTREVIAGIFKTDITGISDFSTATKTVDTTGSSFSEINAESLKYALKGHREYIIEYGEKLQSSLNNEIGFVLNGMGSSIGLQIIDETDGQKRDEIIRSAMGITSTKKTLFVTSIATEADERKTASASKLLALAKNIVGSL